MTRARVAVFVLGVTFASLSGSGCYPCGGPCDGTVHPFPIRSANYQLDYRFAESCPLAEADAGISADAGVEADAGAEAPDAGSAQLCEETVSVDATGRLVTHTFTYRGQKHVVRYKVMSVETIPKNLYDWNDW